MNEERKNSIINEGIKIMKKAKKIEAIVEILRNHEGDLSSGYGYYFCPDEILYQIARKILEIDTPKKPISGKTVVDMY